jgi:hypothetical protein
MEVTDDRTTQVVLIGCGALVGFLIKLGQAGFLYALFSHFYTSPSFPTSSPSSPCFIISLIPVIFLISHIFLIFFIFPLLLSSASTTSLFVLIRNRLWSAEFQAETLVGGHYLLYFGVNLSPALMSVGYIGTFLLSFFPSPFSPLSPLPPLFLPSPSLRN